MTFRLFDSAYLQYAANRSTTKSFESSPPSPNWISTTRSDEPEWLKILSCSLQFVSASLAKDTSLETVVSRVSRSSSSPWEHGVLKNKCREWELNPRPQGYEPCELPLLHPGILTRRNGRGEVHRSCPCQGQKPGKSSERRTHRLERISRDRRSYFAVRTYDYRRHVRYPSVRLALAADVHRACGQRETYVSHGRTESSRLVNIDKWDATKVRTWPRPASNHLS